MTTKTRCKWCESSDLMRSYHDTEWGVPLYDDRKLFEFIILDTFQAGLSWSTILNKRETFRKAFDNFDPVKISGYDEAKIISLLSDPGIIRNNLKVRSAVTNAQHFLRLQKEHKTFGSYIWSFVNHKPVVNSRTAGSPIPASSPQSDAMSKALIKQGFKFVGTTICYAFMQAAGMVNDHAAECFRYEELSLKGKG